MIMWSNHSLHHWCSLNHWCIFTTKHILLLCKALNLISTFSLRSNVLKSRLKWSNPLSKFAVNQIIYILVCTYVLYFCLWSYLYRTSCLPLKSVKVLCVSLPLSAVILCVCLIIHFHWEIWLWQGRPCGFYD